MARADLARDRAPQGAPPPPPFAVPSRLERVTRRRVLSIRWIASAATALLVSVAVLCIGIVAEQNARDVLTRERHERLLLLARNLALGSSSALLGDYPELTLQPLVKETLARQPELAFAVVLDHQGRVQAHPDARVLGSRWAPPADLAPLAGPVTPRASEWLRADRALVVAMSPVVTPGGEAIGSAVVALRRDTIDRALGRARRDQMLVMLGFVLLGMVSALVLMAQLLKPVEALRSGLVRIGRGDLDTRIDVRDRTELGLLAGTVNEMASALQAARAETLERERLSHEVGLARRIQQSLLPATAHRSADCVIDGRQQAANEVGGDWFDFLPLPDGRVAIAIADVSGKGLPGCLVTSMLSALLRALRTTHSSPAAMLAALDGHLAESLERGVFVTMFYGVLEPATGRLVYANAGHNPLLVYRAATGEVETRRGRGIPLGAVRGGAIRRTLADETVVLGHGDLALQYTDGYTEAFRAGGDEQFGIDRLAEVVRRHAHLGAAGLLAEMQDAVAEWTGAGAASDDQTALVVGREVAVAGGAPGSGMPGEAAEALALLEDAERNGHGIELPASLDVLANLRPWLEHLPAVGELTGPEAELLVSALYELCANVVEHGLRGDAERTFELWWRPASESANGADAANEARRGLFVLRDDGAAFDPRQRTASDFTDAEVRKRGRGIGLDIVRRVMRGVAYFPATSRGNLTVLAFGPDASVIHGGPRP